MRLSIGKLERPVLPPLLFVAAGLWPTCALVYSALAGAGASINLFVLALGLLVMAAGALLLWCWGFQPLLLLVLGAALGLASSGQAAFRMEHVEQELEKGSFQHFVVQIVEDVHDSEFGQYALGIARNRNGEAFCVRVNLPKTSQVSCWDVFETTCAIKPPSETAAQYYWNKGCVGSITPQHVDTRYAQGLIGVLGRVREQGSSAFAAYKGDGAMLLSSIVFGDRRELFASPFYGKVKRVGLAHLVAVSGAHLSIAIAFAAFLLSLLHVPRGVSVVVQILLCVGFVILAGAPHSAMRAFMMVACGLSAYFGGRRSFALNALSLCIVLFLLLQPELALSLSLALSAFATFGIVLFAGYFAAWIGELTGKRAKGICEAAGMTIAAVVATLPLSAATFGQISLLSLVSNLLVAPLFAFLCIGGLLSALCALALPSWVLPVVLMGECASLFCRGVELLATIPFAATVVDAPAWIAICLLCALGATLYWFWPTPNRLAAFTVMVASLCSTALLLFFFPLTHNTEIVMLDVGQGDAFVLRSGNKAVLVDTGNQDSAVLKGLARHDIRFLDAVLITHPDSDHCGSLPAVLDFIEVSQVLVAKDLLDCACDNCSSLRSTVGSTSLVGLSEGDNLSWGSFEATVLSPAAFSDEGGNDDSVVLHVGIDADGNAVQDARAFFCGDAESSVLDELDKMGLLAQVDVLKVGHHGSAGAFSLSQIQKLSPTIALVSVGERNRYGHPAPETLSLLEDVGATIYRSDKSGDVVCKISPNGMEVVPLR